MEETPMSETRYVFDTADSSLYRFPTHSNLLIMDRSDSANSEVFWVILEPDEAPPLHVHEDAEQLFYVIEGVGELRTGPEGAHVDAINPGDLVRIPPGTHHSVKARGDRRVVYLSIDCFSNGRPANEPTWDSHVHAMCTQNGWDFDSVRRGRDGAAKG
jgi:mannose-6-phosphate isomerase-like protein (cupin superfamily)